MVSFCVYISLYNIGVAFSGFVEQSLRTNNISQQHVNVLYGIVRQVNNQAFGDNGSEMGKTGRAVGVVVEPEGSEVSDTVSVTPSVQTSDII